MPIQKRFYDTDQCNYFLVQKNEDSITIFGCSDCDENLYLELTFELETALELSREIYHTLKNLKNGGRNEK
jgi:Uri superfamily endonuclease